MKTYHRSKKYLRFIVPVLIIAAAVYVPKADQQHKAEVNAAKTTNGGSALMVSQSGGQIYTNVTADGLQSASAPAGSATSSGLSPQQAVPNYCRPGEMPLTDSCITQ